MSDGDCSGLVSFLCAGCGAEVLMEYVAPGLGLCEACEERVYAAAQGWKTSNMEELDGREEAAD